MKQVRCPKIGILLSLLLGSVIATVASHASEGTILQEYSRLTDTLGTYLESFSKTIAGIPDPDRQQPQWKEIRKLKTELWLKLLESTNQVRDHSFNFADVPTINVAPPLPYDSGVDPSAIKDSIARREYEEEIRKNKEKAAKFGFENRLKRLEETFTLEAVQYIAASYEPNIEDSKELRGLLDTSHMNAEQKADLTKRLQNLLSTR